MSRTAEDTITPKVANHALHYFKSNEGFSGGEYSDRLFTLISVADEAHLAKLVTIHQGEVAAYQLGKFPGGIETLRIMASLPMLEIVR